MHEVRMRFSWEFCNNTRLFWDFSYLKRTATSVWKVNSTADVCPGNYQKNGRKIWRILFNEAIAMKCQKQSSECSVKDILKIFAKLTRKHLCRSLFLIRDYRDSSAGVFLWIFQNFKFVEHLGSVASEMIHD